MSLFWARRISPGKDQFGGAGCPGKVSWPDLCLNTKQKETFLQRLGYVLPLLVAFYLLSQPGAHYGWLGERFVPYSPIVEWIGVLVTAAGVGVAFWARWHLGTNWSGSVTLKEGHELIRTGPYRAIRHPIYMGILLALLGTAMNSGEVRALLALGIAWMSFYIKARREESFLAQEFGAGFTQHLQHTGMFLPRLTSLSEVGNS